MERIRRHIFFRFSIAFFGAMAFAFLWNGDVAGEEGLSEDIIITVHRQAEVVHANLRLGDVADIVAPMDVKPAIERIALMGAPHPGAETTVTGSRLSSIIRRNKWLPENTRIDVPSHVMIRRASMVLAKNNLEDFLQDYVAVLLPDTRFAINRFKVRGDRVFPVGEMQLQAEDKEQDISRGRINLPVVVLVNGEKAGKIFLSGRIERSVSVVCARHDVVRDQVLSHEDLYLREVTIMKDDVGRLRSIDQAIGKRLKQSLRAGSDLREDMLEEPLLVQRGDKVRLVANGTYLTVVTEGIAKGDGRLNDRIKVENVETRQTVEGYVASASTVLVSF